MTVSDPAIASSGGVATNPVVRHAVLDSPIGPLTVVALDGSVTAVHFELQRYPADPASLGDRDEDALAGPVRQLAEYFNGLRTTFDLLLAPVGNAFQRRVWALLRAIPYGETRSYGQLAAQLGDPGLARAVGAANGRNPISIVVPCHRVIGTGGKLVGYGGGLERKAYLLQHEARVSGSLSLF